MKEILNYKIHDILGVKIIRHKKIDLLKGLNLEFSFFQTEEEFNYPDILLKIGKFKPTNDNCYAVDHKYYVKNNYFYCKDAMGRISWELEIEGFEEGDMIINFNYNILDPRAYISLSSIETFLLRPIIYYKLIKKNYVMIHSAGVSKDFQGYIFTGRGGVYKTTLTMNFIKKGFDYLGDDRVILKDGNVFSFPGHFHVFEYIYQNLETEKMGFKDKVGIIIKLRKNTLEKCNRVPVADKSRLKKVFFVTKTNSQKICVNDISLKEATERLVASNKLEMGAMSDTIAGFRQNPYFRYMDIYSYVFPQSAVAKYWKDFENIIKKNIGKIPIYEIMIPAEYDSSVFDEMYRMVNK